MSYRTRRPLRVRSVLPVQCLCEFLSAGGAGGEAGKAGELCAHLRRTVADSADGARAVLHCYMQRLAHAHAPTRASAKRVRLHFTTTFMMRIWMVGS